MNACAFLRVDYANEWRVHVDGSIGATESTESGVRMCVCVCEVHEGEKRARQRMSAIGA